MEPKKRPMMLLLHQGRFPINRGLKNWGF